MTYFNTLTSKPSLLAKPLDTTKPNMTKFKMVGKEEFLSGIQVSVGFISHTLIEAKVLCSRDGIVVRTDGGKCNIHNIKIDNRVIYNVYTLCKPIQSMEI